MKMRQLLLAGIVFNTSFVALSHANDIDFSLGVSAPLAIVPEISMAGSVEDKSRFYLRYVMGLDDGFALGYQQAFSSDNKHSWGLLVGALGTKRTNSELCKDKEVSNGLACALSKIFEEETTNGIGASYYYHFNGINQAGWRIGADLGYGKAHESHIKRVDGNISLSYQF